MLIHQSIHKIVRFWMINGTKEMKHVLNRMTQFTLVLSSDFPHFTLANSFIVGAHVLLMDWTKFNFAILNICVREIDRLKQFFLWNNTRKLYVNYWKQSNLVNIYCVLSRLRNYINKSGCRNQMSMSTNFFHSNWPNMTNYQYCNNRT